MTIRVNRLLALPLVLFACAASADNWEDPSWRYAFSPFVQLVREATAQYADVQTAIAAGYDTPLLGCVSSPDGGAMGIHYLNVNLLGDGAVDAAHPEALIYEPLPGGELRLVAVEYITFAPVWDASHKLGDGTLITPVLKGQVFNYEDAPNRYGAPPHYDLHVWAWKRNPSGTFADWNRRVSCDAYDPAS